MSRLFVACLCAVALALSLGAASTVTNGSVETDTTGWTWYIGSGTCTYSRSTDYSFHGVAAHKLADSGTDLGTAQLYQYWTGFKRNTQYHFRYAAKKAVGSTSYGWTVQVIKHVANYDQCFTRNDSVSDTNWKVFDDLITSNDVAACESGSVQYRFRFYMDGDDGGGGAETWYFDDIQLCEGTCDRLDRAIYLSDNQWLDLDTGEQFLAVGDFPNKRDPFAATEESWADDPPAPLPSRP